MIVNLYANSYMRYSRIITLMAIQNLHVPVCKTCKFYRPYYYTNFDSTLSDCNAVGKMNIVSGNIEYSSASTCRMNVELKENHFCKMNRIYAWLIF